MESTLHVTKPPAVALDCRNVASRSLRSIMKSSCLALRKGQNVYFGCHVLYGFLQQFNKPAFTVNDVLLEIQKEEDILLPRTVTGVIKLISALNDKGLLLLLEDTSDLARSLVIFQKGKLISEVNGKLFAPEYMEYMSTGVVSLSAINNKFKQYDPSVLIKFLTHLEFCHEMDEHAKLVMDSRECTNNSEEKYFLFPGLIKNERPENIWSGESNGNEENEYCCGWALCCTKSEELLETRFLRVLLLRLAFSFALISEKEVPPTHGCLPAITMHCKMWKSGIHWFTTKGVETIVEVLEENKKLVLRMKCGKKYVDSCAKLRSEVIVEILKAKDDFCDAVSTEKYLMNCSQPLDEPSLFSIKEMIPRVHNRTLTHAVDTKGAQTMPIEGLLGFEPYISIDRNIVQKVLSKGDTDTPVQEEWRKKLIENCTEYNHFREHLKGYKDLTFQTLRHEIFDKFSIFDAKFHEEIVAGASGDPGDIPNMDELVSFQGREKIINIPLEICTMFIPFGILLLDTDSWARVNSIVFKHKDDVEQINKDILQQWIEGKGKKPVTWKTLIDVLRDVELTTLAEDIAAVKCPQEEQNKGNTCTVIRQPRGPDDTRGFVARRSNEQ